MKTCSCTLKALNSATQESGNQESTFQLVCLLLMTKPFGLFIWTVLQDPDGLLILFTLLRWPSIFYTQVLYHLCWKSKMQHSCVVGLFITADYSQDYSYKSVSTNSIRIEL